jgi:hypothetical protein
VAVPVVNVRVMWMHVGNGCVFMRMRVRLAALHAWVVLVLMMLIMRV